jgi:CheY-like chemotaxis protein
MMRHLASIGPPGGPLSVVPGDASASPGPVTAKILAADDDPRNLVAVEELLRAPGVEVVLARSGEDVLRRVLTDDFAVILLDVQMPGLDGYETATMLRTRPRTSRTPIIFLTAFNKDELHVFRGYSAGAVDYVFKPIEPLILRSKVDVFVDLYRKTEEIRRGAEEERRLCWRTCACEGRSSRPSRRCAGARSSNRSCCNPCPSPSTRRRWKRTTGGSISRTRRSSASPASRRKPSSNGPISGKSG